MPNTTNYSFPTPADTDLVKNGADAIRDLGDAVDTAMNTALGTKKAGMVLLNTTSFSGVTSISAPASTFSADYIVYRIVLTMNSAISGDVRMRMRAAGTDTTGSVYAWNVVQLSNSSQTTYDYVRSAGYTTSSTVGASSATQEAFMIIDIQNPFATKNTAFFIMSNNLGNTDVQTFLGGSRINDTTSYDSVTFFNASGGNINGSLRIYGVNQ